MSSLVFLREFVRDPVCLGAVAPSGPSLARLTVGRFRTGLLRSREVSIRRLVFPDRSVFVWLHLFDAHRPYDEENRFLERYWPAERDKHAPSTKPYPPAVLNHELDAVVDSDYMDASYKAEVTYVDWTLARVFEHPRLRDAWIGVTADHGECLGEHEVWWNHEGVFPQNLHVPMVLAGAICTR